MVNIQPKVLEELKGCQSFGFKTSNHIQDQRSLNLRGMDAQAAVCARVKATLEAFQNLPCDIDLQVGARQGHEILTGNIYPYDGSSQQKAHSIMREVDQMAHAFSQNYPDSEFLISYTQSVAITRVDRYRAS